jgi:hypothetical protein
MKTIKSILTLTLLVLTISFAQATHSGINYSICTFANTSKFILAVEAKQTQKIKVKIFKAGKFLHSNTFKGAKAINYDLTMLGEGEYQVEISSNDIKTVEIVTIGKKLALQKQIAKVIEQNAVSEVNATLVDEVDFHSTINATYAQVQHLIDENTAQEMNDMVLTPNELHLLQSVEAYIEQNVQDDTEDKVLISE